MAAAESFGKYLLLEKIASGGMAEVYLAKSPGVDGVQKFLALKRILPQYSEHPEFIEMFKEEAKICVNLNNSNIVSIFDFGVEKNQFFLVMEFVEGKNLRQIINELKTNANAFSVDQVAYIIKEIASGLDHAHRCIDDSTGKPLNIVHRDMSPQNIMVSYEGEVKIIDFGIAKAENQIDSTKTGTLKGKFGYMSPEQADGQNVDPRTDLFSVGILMWELLSNERLFAASSEAATLRKIREMQIPMIRKINPGVPPELEKILHKILAKDRNLRYQTAAVLHKDLNKFLNIAYPEFNARDFSIFIKNLFNQAYKDSRRRLVEYSKSNFVIQAKVEDTSTDTLIEEQLDLDTEAELKVDLKLKKEPPNKNKVWMNPPLNPTGTKSKITLPKKDLGFAGRNIFLGLTVLTVSFFVFKDSLRKISFARIESSVIEPVLPPVTTVAPPVPAPAPESFQLTILSQPQYAEIFIDDVPLKEFTPKVKSLLANHKYLLKLKKPDYFPYEKEIVLTQPVTTIQAKLQPLGKAAFLNVNIPIGSSQVDVYVNGKKISQLPVTQLPLAPNQTHKIKAINRSTAAVSEENVYLKPGQKKTLELIPKSTKQQVR